MSISKRLRLIFAALRQDWHQHTCHCGRTQWVEGKEGWTDPFECTRCESEAFEAWQAEYEARQRRQQQFNNREVA